MIISAFHPSLSQPVRSAQYQPRSTYGPRTLPDFELVWITSGSAVWTVTAPGQADTARHALRDGSIVLARPGHTDSFEWDAGRWSSHGYAHFTLPDDEAERLGDAPLVWHHQRSDVAGTLCAHLLHLAVHEEQFDETVQEQVIGVIIAALLAQDVRQPEWSRPVQRAVAAVRRSWREEGMRAIPIDRLATESGVTSSHLSRLFTHDIGGSLSQSIELVRLGYAAMDLQRTNNTLSMIAERRGFPNPYHLSRRFRLYYGTPPGRFRVGSHGDPLAPLESRGLMPLWWAINQPGSDSHRMTAD